MDTLPIGILGDEKRIVLFHGTSLPSSGNLLTYLNRGLLPRNLSNRRTLGGALSQLNLVYLSTFDDPHKENYARKCAHSKYAQTITGKQITLTKGYAFEVEVDTENLGADEDTRTSTWQGSLCNYIGSCTHKGPIPPKHFIALHVKNDYDRSFTRIPKNEIRRYIFDDMKRQFDNLISLNDNELRIFKAKNERLDINGPVSRNNFYNLAGYDHISWEGKMKIGERRMTKEGYLSFLRGAKEVALTKGYCAGSAEELESAIREIEETHN